MRSRTHASAAMAASVPAGQGHEELFITAFTAAEVESPTRFETDVSIFYTSGKESFRGVARDQLKNVMPHVVLTLRTFCESTTVKKETLHIETFLFVADGSFLFTS